MVKNELWSRHRLLTLLITGMVSLMVLSGCSAASKRPMVGTEMNLESAGQEVYILFISYPHLNHGRNQDRRNNGGFVSQRGPKTMALIGAGGFKEFPPSITFEWLTGLGVDPKDMGSDDYIARGTPYSKTIDLTVIPDAALQEVHADPKRKLLQLTFTFKDDDVTMKWAVYKWR